MEELRKDFSSCSSSEFKCTREEKSDKESRTSDAMGEEGTTYAGSQSFRFSSRLEEECWENSLAYVTLL